MQGTIWLVIRNLGYGFIEANDGTSVFFHRNDLLGLDFERLKAGDVVEVEIVEGPKGLRAVSVRSGKPDRSAA